MQNAEDIRIQSHADKPLGSEDPHAARLELGEEARNFELGDENNYEIGDRGKSIFERQRDGSDEVVASPRFRGEVNSAFTFQQQLSQS